MSRHTTQPPAFEPLEARLLLDAGTELTATQKDLILEGLTAFNDTAGLFNTNEALDSDVELLGQGMGPAFDIEGLLVQDVINQSETYFTDNTSWTLGGWATALRDNAALSTIANLSYDTSETGVVSFTFDVTGEKTLHDWQLDLSERFAAWDFDTLGFSTDGMLGIDVAATFTGDLTMGVDTNLEGGNPKGFFVDGAGLSLDMSFSGSAPLAIDLDMFSLTTGTITGSGVEVGVTLVDPDDSGRIYTDELNAGGADLVSATFDASSASIDVPLEFAATPGMTVDAFDPATKLTMTAADFVTSHDLTVGLSNLGNLVTATALSPQAMATGFLQLAQYLGGTQGIAVMRQELPLLGGDTVGDILDIPLAITDGVNTNIFSVDEESGTVTPLFDDFEGFATALSAVQDLVHVDPNARELTIDFDYTYDFTAFDAPLTFTAGVAGMELGTSSTLSLGGSVDMQFTMGLRLGPDQVLDLMPVGRNAPTEEPAAAILDGQLDNDAHVTITLDGWDDTDVTVPWVNTTTNSDLLDLVDDVNTALATAGLNGAVEAYLVDFNTLGREVTADDFSNPDYDGTGLIAFRTVTAGEYWSLRVSADEGDPSNTLLGYPADLSVKPSLPEFFIDDAAITATVSLSASTVTAGGSFNIVEVGLGGSAAVTGTVSGALVNPDTGDGRIDFADFQQFAADKRWAEMLDMNLSGSGAVVFDDIQVAGLGGLSLGPAPEIAVLVNDITDPHTLTPQFNDLGNLGNLESLSVSEVLGILSQGTEFLSTVDGLEFLQYDIPILNASAADVLDTAGGWAATVEQAQAAGEEGDSLQAADGNLDGFFGGQGLDYALTLDGTSLKLSAEYALSSSRTSPFNLDLNALLDLAAGDTSGFDQLTGLVDVGGSSQVTVSGEASVSLVMGLDLSDPAAPSPFIYDESSLELGMRLAGTDLDFRFSFGPMSAHIKNGWAVLDADGDADTVDYATFTIGMAGGDGDGRHYLGDAGEPILDDLTQSVTAAAGVGLPAYFPSDSIPLGGAGNNEIQLAIASLEDVMTETPGSVTIQAPDVNSLFSDVNIIELLADPAAALDGLQTQFDLVGDSLAAIVSYADLPLVGDQLNGALDFVQDLGDDLFGQVRTTLNRALDGENPPELLREALYGAFGSLLTDSNEDGTIDLDDVAMTIDEADYEFIEYRLDMGGTLLSTSIDFGGLDILPLDLDGQVDADLSWQWDFGFGMHVNDGFYIISDAAPELSLDLAVTMPEDLHGELFFLNADVTSMDDAGTSVDRSRSLLAGSFTIDLVDPSGDGRLTFAEINGNALGDLVVAGFDGELSADLRMTLSAGGSDLFPQFRTVASLDWGFDKTFGAPVETAPLTVEFTTVELNLGSLVNGFLRPVFEQVDEIVDPIRPVLDFLQQELPIIDMTVLDVASAFGYGQYTDFIGAVTWAADMAEAVATAPTGDFWLDMGSFSVTGDAGTSEGGTITPTATPDFMSNLNASGAGQDRKDFLTEANAGNSYFSLNLLEPSTIFDLVMGNDTTLMTFSIPDLEISANYSQYFPVYGPLGMRLSGSASATLHLGFGYDTYGLRRSQETGNWSYLLDGFYVSDRANADGTGADTPEVVFGLGFTAAAELNMGVASGGVSGGIYGDMGLDLADPDDDGKLRMTELWGNLQDPRRLFDIDIIVTAEVGWYVTIGWGEFSKTFDGTLASTTLYEDTFTAPREEVLVKPATEGRIVVNAGAYAGDRLYEDTGDGAESVSIAGTGDTLQVTVNGAEQTIDYRQGEDAILIEAGKGADTIVIDASVRADVIIDGGAGDDTIETANTGTATVCGGDGNDVITAGSSQPATIDGGAGDDTIQGGSADDTIRGGAGNDSLAGGDGSDTFVFADGFGDDTISDASGANDVLDFSATNAPLTFDVTAQRLDSTAGDSAALGFTPETVIGSDDSDTLVARDEENTWAITGANQGTYNALFDFASFEQLVGRADRDTFIFADGASVSDRIDGGAGTENDPDATYAQHLAGDVIDLSAYSTSNRWQVSTVNGGRLYLKGANPAFTSVENHTGGAERDYLVYSNDQYVVGMFDGNGGEDRIDLSDYELVDVYKRNIWDFTGVNQGSVNERTAFTAVENHTGGAIEDTFYVYPSGTYAEGFLHAPSGAGGGINGSIDAEDRNDTISDSPVVRVSSTLHKTSRSTAPAPLSKSGASGDDLRLDETSYDVTWEVTGENTGTRTDDNGTVTFENLQNIEGSPDRELFIIHPGGSMDGFIDGKGGSDALIYGWAEDTYTDPVTIDFQNANEATATAIGGGILNIEHLTSGTSSNDSLVGPNLATDWTVTNENAGSMYSGSPVTFEGFDIVTGGSGEDTFAFGGNGELTGHLAGGAGADEIDLSPPGAAVETEITAANEGRFRFAGGNWVNISQIESVTTGTQADTLTFMGNDAQLTGEIQAGGGDDSVIYSGSTANRTVHIDYANAGRLSRISGTTTFDGVENITTDSGDDTFIFADGTGVDGTLDAGTGTDIFDYSSWNAVSPATVNLQALQASGTGAFIDVEQFLGGESSSNHLTAANDDNTWTIDGVDDGTVDNGTTYRFYDFQHLTGGTANDAFAFEDMDYVHGPVEGAAGNDTIDFTGYSLAQTWDITGPNAGTLRMTETQDPLALPFTGIENVAGGDGGNAVTLDDGATLTSLQGGSDVDTLDLSGYTTAVEIDLQANAMTPIDTFGGFEQITASSAADTLIGANDDRTWYTYDDNALYYDATTEEAGGAVTVTDYAVDVRSVENLAGGTAADTFGFAESAGIAGTLDGGGGANTASWHGCTGALTVDLDTQTATGIGETWSHIGTFIGGNATDTLAAPNGQANAWDIEATDAGQVGDVAFERFGNLTGGTGDDTFTLADGAAVTGTIAGAGGTNTLNLAAYSTPVSFNLGAGTATGTAGFAAIDTFIGGTAFDSLTGTDSDATWTITADNTGTVGAWDFEGVESLVGGTGDDTFVMGANGALGGTVTGGTGWDHIDYHLRTSGVTVNRRAAAATATGGFAGIEEFTASAAADDHLTGKDIEATWNLTEDFGGTINGATAFAFHGFEQLTGGSAADTFVLATGTHSAGHLDGAGGNDTLDLSAHTIDREIHLTGIDRGTVIGVAGFQAVEELIATGGDDTVIFDDQAALTGSADGQGGTDTLDYSAYQTAVAVNIDAGAATGLGGYTSFEAFEAGAADDNSVAGPAAGGTYRVTGENLFELDQTHTFTGFQNLDAGDGADVFTFVTGGQLTGTLDGGGGTNTADFSAFGNDLTVNLNSGGVTGLAGAIAGMNELIADPLFDNTLIAPDTDNDWQITADDTGTLNDLPFANFGTLVGGSGADQFVFADGTVVSGSLDGSTDIDSINLDAYTTINTWRSLPDGSVEIKTNFGTFTYTSVENFSANMAVYLFTHHDLRTDWESLDLPAALVPGESAQVDLKITNLSNVPFSDTAAVTVYASGDRTLDLADDVCLGTSERRLSLRQDEFGTMSVYLEFPVDMNFGDYYLIAMVDPDNKFDEMNEANNTDVTDTTQSVSRLFGNIEAGRNVVLNFPQAGRVLQYSLAGPGWGTVTAAGAVELFDTTNRTRVQIIQIDGETRGELPGLTVDGSIKTIDAADLLLTGDIDIAGGVRRLALGNCDPAVQNHITIGESTTNAWVTLGDVTNADLTADSPVRYLKTGPWLDSDGDADTLTVTDVHTLSINGRMDAGVTADAIHILSINGDAAGTVTTTGEMTNFFVSGEVTGAIDVGGTMSRVRIGGDLSGSMEVDDDIGRASLAALSGRLQGLGRMWSLYVAGDLSGEVFIFRNLKTTHIVGGDLSGRIGTNETLGKLHIHAANGVGGALTGTVEAGDWIKSLKTSAASSGMIDAPLISRLALNGGFDGVIRAVGGADEFDQLARRQNIGSLYVWNGDLRGTVEATSIRRIHCAGDVLADLTLTGQDVYGYSLGYAYVAGTIDGTWDFTDPACGSIGAIIADSTAAGWQVDAPASHVSTLATYGDMDGVSLTAHHFGTMYAGGTLGVAEITATGGDPAYGISVAKLFADTARDVSVDVPGGLYLTTVTEWRDTDATVDTIDAAWATKFFVTGRDGAFQSAVTLDGINPFGGYTLYNGYIRGDLTSSVWNVTGDVGTFTVIKGAYNSRLQATGNIGKLSLGATIGSDFLAGVESDFAGRRAEAPADYLNNGANNTARIGSIVVNGWEGGPAILLVDSNITAVALGPTYLRDYDAVDTYRLTVLDTEENFSYVRYTDSYNTADSWYWWAGQAKPDPLTSSSGEQLCVVT